jgi:hypothetical protein
MSDSLVALKKLAGIRGQVQFFVDKRRVVFQISIDLDGTKRKIHDVQDDLKWAEKELFDAMGAATRGDDTPERFEIGNSSSYGAEVHAREGYLFVTLALFKEGPDRTTEQIGRTIDYLKAQGFRYKGAPLWL